MAEEKKEEKIRGRRAFLATAAGTIVGAIVTGVGVWALTPKVEVVKEVPVVKEVTTTVTAPGATVTTTAAAVTHTVTTTAPAVTKEVTKEVTVTAPTVTPTVPVETLPVGWEKLKPATPLIWSGGSWGMYTEIVDEWKRITGTDFVWTTIAIPEMLMRMLATGGKGLDIMHVDTSNALAFIKAKPAVVQPIPVEKLAWWGPEELAPQWTTPETTIGLNYGKENAEYLAKSVIYPNVWWEGEVGKRLALPPRIYNFDSICWNPEFIPFEVHSWASIVDRQFKGRAAIQDVFVIDVNEWCAYLVNSGQMAKPEVGINNLKPEEVDIVIDFLIGHKKAGQFKTFWPDYGACVNVHTTREVWISDGWQPVEMDVRRGAAACYYADVDEGYRNWYSGDMPSVATDKLDWCYQFINWVTMSGWHARYIIRNSYQVPNYTSKRVREYFEPEYYNWQYHAVRTSKPCSEAVKDVWPDRPDFWDLPDRITNALFVPERYKWSRVPVVPNFRGVIRDGGDLTRHWDKVATWQIWPDNADYYAAAWDRLKAA